MDKKIRELYNIEIIKHLKYLTEMANLGKMKKTLTSQKWQVGDFQIEFIRGGCTIDDFRTGFMMAFDKEETLALKNIFESTNYIWSDKNK